MSGEAPLSRVAVGNILSRAVGRLPVRTERMSNATPGPWHVGGTWYTVVHVPSKIIANCTDVVTKPDDLPEDQANAQLMAAAPDMLTALSELLAAVKETHAHAIPSEVYACRVCMAQLKARAAITKARGE